MLLTNQRISQSSLPFYCKRNRMRKAWQRDIVQRAEDIFIQRTEANIISLPLPSYLSHRDIIISGLYEQLH